MSTSRPVLHVEARLLPGCLPDDAAEARIRDWLLDNYHSLSLDQEITAFDGSAWLSDNLERLAVVEAAGSTDSDMLQLSEIQLVVHVYRLHAGSQGDVLHAGDDGNNSPTAQVFDLPAKSLDGLWESLVFETDIKTKLLRFVSSLLFFAEKNVSFAQINFNRLVLLHGPPGSGKTSLCRALAQKLSIRLSKSFPTCKLVEINSHSLFSKYFSESGKLVGAMFEEIFKMLGNEEMFTVVLIDEVETLTSSRKAAAMGNEPSDGLRVVNALLTALDRLRDKSNVIVLTTSNLLEAMDAAFLDRADITQFVETPKPEAIYTIFRSCLQELIRTGIIIDQAPIPCAAEATLCLFSEPKAPSTRLWRCACSCTDFSGRTLRRLPVVMHASYIMSAECSLAEALDALENVVEDENTMRRLMGTERGGAGARANGGGGQAVGQQLRRA